ncbi:MAG: inosine/xanthosine triphosphatase [Chlamydiota bacterium]
MIVRVGSMNRVKRSAAEEVCREIFGAVTVVCCSADPGVSATPRTDEEMITGALARARQAFALGGADLGVGLEGGVTPSPHGPLLKGWAAVCDGTRESIGATPSVPFPAHLLERVGEGGELARVMDEVSGRKGVRENEGAFGILTRNRITRTESFKLALVCALAPIVNREMYSGPGRGGTEVPPTDKGITDREPGDLFRRMMEGA